MKLNPFQSRETALLVLMLVAALILGYTFTLGELSPILAGLFGIGAILFCQFNLKRWIYLIILSIPLSPPIHIMKIRYEMDSGMADFLVLGIWFLFFINLAVGAIFRKGIDRYIVLPLISYVVICLISSFLAYYMHSKEILILNAVGHLVKWASQTFLYVIIFKSFRTEKDFKNLIRVILVAGALMALVAINNYFHFTSITPNYRAIGIFKGVNAFGVYIALILIFAFNLIQQRKAKEVFPLWLMLPCCAVMLLAVVMTFSRTSWLLLGGGLIAMTFIRGRRDIAILLVFLTLASFLVLRERVQKRIEVTMEGNSLSTIPIDLSGRPEIWIGSLNLIGPNIILGVGYSNFQQTYLNITPHNSYIQILGESGIFALIAFLIFCYRLCKALLYLYRHHPSPFFRECAFGTLVLFVGLVIVSGTGEYMYGSLTALLGFYACSRVTFQMEMEKKPAEKELSLLLPINLNYLKS